MKIVSVHEGIVPISSSIRNAWIDFSSMDCSIVAVVSDVIVRRQTPCRVRVQLQRPVLARGTSCAAGSSPACSRRPGGRDPRTRTATNFDPTKAWDFLMRNEKPGGHGERSVAVGVIDMALFDLAAKVAGQPLYRFLSDKYGDGQPDDSVFVYAAGGYYAPDKGLPELQDEMRRFLDLGYRVVKMKIGGAALARGPRAHRVRAGRRRRRRAAPRGRRQRPVRPVRGAGVRARRSSPTTCSGTRRSATRWTTPSTPPCPSTTSGRIATGENLFSLQDARNLIRYGGMRPDRDIIQVDPALSYGLTEYLRIQDMLAPARLVLPPVHPARRAPVLPAHRGGAQARRQRVLPGRVPAHRRLRRRRRGAATARSGSPTSPASASRARPSSTSVLRELHAH